VAPPCNIARPNYNGLNGLQPADTEIARMQLVATPIGGTDIGVERLIGLDGGLASPWGQG
jgi:hypothetical protein